MKLPLVPRSEVEITAVRSQGAGGQNVNKVSSAVHLRFDIPASSLPESVKQQLLASNDRRITGEGVLVLKAQTQRSRELNLADALQRLQALVDQAAIPSKSRRATKPTRASRQRRLEGKSQRAELKSGRRKPSLD